MQWKTKYLHLYLLDLFVFFWLVLFPSGEKNTHRLVQHVSDWSSCKVILTPLVSVLLCSSVSSTCTSCVFQSASIFALLLTSLTRFSALFLLFTFLSPLLISYIFFVPPPIFLCLSSLPPFSLFLSLPLPFSKLNSRVNPCSFRPSEKKGGQKGKDSSLFGISIKMKVAPYFCTKKRQREMENGRKTWTRDTIKREKAC